MQLYGIPKKLDHYKDRRQRSLSKKKNDDDYDNDDKSDRYRDEKEKNIGYVRATLN